MPEARGALFVGEFDAKASPLGAKGLGELTVTSKPHWTFAFAAGSALAAFCQGLILGSLIQGIKVESGAFAGSAFDWATPFAVLCGLGLVAGYGLLGATWLVMKTEGRVAEHARMEAKLLLLAVLAFMAIVSLWTPLKSRRTMRNEAVPRQDAPPQKTQSACRFQHTLQALGRHKPEARRRAARQVLALRHLLFARVVARARQACAGRGSSPPRRHRHPRYPPEEPSSRQCAHCRSHWQPQPYSG